MQFDIMAQCCSMDGTSIAIALTRSIRIFDSLSGKQIGPNLSLHSDIITSISFSPDNQLASGSFDYTIRIWNLNTQTQIGDPFIKDKASVRFVKYVNSQILASLRDNYINIWNTDNRTLIHSLRCRSNALTINCGPFGNTIVSATNSFISLWNIKSGRKRSLMDKNYNLSINISPNQKLITSGYQRYNLAIEETEVIVRIWSNTKKLLTKFVIITELLQLFFSQDNQFIVSAFNNFSIQLLDIVNRTKTFKMIDGYSSNFLCDGRYILSENHDSENKDSSIIVQEVTFD